MTTKIEPFSDPALEELAQAIFNALNLRSPDSVRSWRVVSGADPAKAIGSVAAVHEFPLLIIRQESATGEDFQKCRGEIGYLILVASGRGRSLTWVQRSVAAAIREYVDFQPWPLCAVNYSGMTARQEPMVSGADLFLRTLIRFEYEDRATL